MWLQVSFTQDRVVDIWRGDSTFSGHETDTMSGLRVWRDVTVGFDITGLTELLSCPRQFRKVNSYQAKFIELVHRDSIEQSLSQTPTTMELFEDDVRKNSTEIRALTRESSWNMGPAEALVEVKKLEEEEKQQKVSGEYDKEAGAYEEPGEVLVEVPPQDAPANGHAVEAVEWGLH
ncbi:hypothetical protein Focb16_v003837 [Fusarium oxysporum f. sp. cubense]|uniref:Uncharacterized protein n=1 Tax=Fusarium oxysporum f. sp. cubense TaxID=61366 RepID=A0A559KLF3_FUSOC|nr:hypothetical protein Focb16_v003837 [Fusarium oxysporum f. sp. cubense]